MRDELGLMKDLFCCAFFIYFTEVEVDRHHSSAPRVKIEDGFNGNQSLGHYRGIA